MKRPYLAILALALLVTPAAAQRHCEQKEASTWEITIAGENEAGERLVVEGIVTDDEGQPVSGATVYVYQTDARGLYAPPGEDPSVARLCGRMRTGDDGRYRYRTIRPASYPGGRIAQHIHYVVSVPGGDDHTFLLEFADDALITANDIERDRERTPDLEKSYRGIQPLVREGEEGVLKCTRNLRVTTR